MAGSSSIEFALVALPFIFMLIATMDLGRYFLTRHSLHTLVDEAVRSAIVNCFNQKACAYGTAVPTPSNLWGKVPFLDQGTSGASVTASQTYDNATGIRTITATANYPFSFVLPAWSGLFTTGISETTQLKY
jgi:Flp pilus assembly protein TadG